MHIPVIYSSQLLAQDLSDLSPIINLDNRPISYDLSKYLEFLEDKDNILTIDQISSLDFSNRFKLSDRDPPAFGYSDSIRWGRLRLHNISDRDTEWILSLEYPQIDRISLYLPNPKHLENWIIKNTGLLYPFSSRDIADRLPAFHINVPAQTTQNIYLRFQTTTPLIVQANLSNPVAFWKYRASQNIWIGLVYGVLIFAVLYNLVLFATLQDLVYLYYVIFATGVVAIFIAIDGFGTQYLWQNAIWWNKYAVATIGFATLLSLLEWISLFLETKKFLPKWHWILRSQQVVTIILLLGLFVLPFKWISISSTLIILCGCSLAFLLGAIAFRNGYKPARYYVLSFSLFLFSVVANQLGEFNVIPDFDWIKDSYRAGIVAFVVFMSLALADRINLLKAEKLLTQKLALEEKDILNENLKRSQAQLLDREQQLEYDVLTGLANRTWLTQRLQDLLQQKQKFALLFIDLDRFKVINDSLGHLVGDELLKQATIRMQSILPDFGKLTRFGGDEFVILLEELSDLESITKIADLLQMQLQLPFYLNNYELFISASVGINLSTEEYKLPEEILRDADLAMYQAKHRGRKRYELFTQSDRVAALSRLNLERDLRRALDKNEFYLTYQPIVSLQTRQVCGFEALVRWKNSAGKQIPPNEFIPITEETGLINSLGWWIMEEACQQMQLWKHQLNNANLSININVSPIQLRQFDFVKTLKRILIETGLPNHCLKLEITESCLLENIDSDTNLIKQIKDLGIQLCIDDFGTGYSSLSRLHDLPIDTLKIDQSFIKRIGSGSDSTVIIETIISLSQSLNLHTVAEGVETRSQLDKLIEIGCNLGQGYLFSRPCEPDAAYQLLQNGLTLAADYKL